MGDNSNLLYLASKAESVASIARENKYEINIVRRNCINGVSIQNCILQNLDGFFHLYDEYRLNGKRIEKISENEIYSDDKGNISALYPESFTPYSNGVMWCICDSFPDHMESGVVYVVQSGTLSSFESIIDRLSNRINCSHKFENGSSSVRLYNYKCNCTLCNKTWNTDSFIDQYKGAAGVRYMKYTIKVLKTRGAECVAAYANDYFQFGYEDNAVIESKEKHILTADRIILAARAFYEMGCFEYTDEIYVYVKYTKNEDFIKMVGATYPTGIFRKMWNKIFKRAPLVQYDWCDMYKWSIGNPKYECLNDYADVILGEYTANKSKSRNRKLIDMQVFEDLQL